MMFKNEKVADASENAEMIINHLLAKKHRIASILGRVRKKHLLEHFVRPDDTFNDLDKIFEQLNNAEKEDLFKYLEAHYK